MWEYSKSALSIFNKKINTYLLILRILHALLIISYYTYAIITGIGNLIINIVLLSLFSAYTIFVITTRNMKIKFAKKVVKRIYKISRLLVRGISLGASIYGIYIAVNNVKPITIILTTLMLIVWVIQVVVELIKIFILPKLNLLVAGVIKDVEPYVKTANKVIDLRNGDPIELHQDKYQKEIEIISPDAEKLIQEREYRKEDRKADKKQARKDKFKSIFTRSNKDK